MKKMIVLVLIFGGLWSYAERRFNFSDALAYAKKHQASSWAPKVVYSVGLVYYQRAEYAKSQEAFTQLLTDYPTGQYTPKALLRLYEVAAETRDFETARSAISRFIEEYPDHPDIQLAQKRYELVRNH